MELTCGVVLEVTPPSDVLYGYVTVLPSLRLSSRGSCRHCERARGELTAFRNGVESLKSLTGFAFTSPTSEVGTISLRIDELSPADRDFSQEAAWGVRPGPPGAREHSALIHLSADVDLDVDPVHRVDGNWERVGAGEREAVGLSFAMDGMDHAITNLLLCATIASPGAFAVSGILPLQEPVTYGTFKRVPKDVYPAVMAARELGWPTVNNVPASAAHEWLTTLPGWGGCFRGKSNRLSGSERLV